jgi:hypothetical protein
MDFVCPERIDQCLQLASEFRHLSKNHCRQQDILQAKNLLFQTFWQLFAKGVGSGGGSGNDQDDGYY